MGSRGASSGNISTKSKFKGLKGDLIKDLSKSLELYSSQKGTNEYKDIKNTIKEVSKINFKPLEDKLEKIQQSDSSSKRQFYFFLNKV